MTESHGGQHGNRVDPGMCRICRIRMWNIFGQPCNLKDGIVGKFVSYIFAIFAKRARCSFRPINGIEQTQAGQSGGKGCTATSRTIMYALHFLLEFIFLFCVVRSGRCKNIILAISEKRSQKISEFSPAQSVHSFQGSQVHSLHVSIWHKPESEFGTIFNQNKNSFMNKYNFQFRQIHLI